MYKNCEENLYAGQAISYYDPLKLYFVLHAFVFSLRTKKDTSTHLSLRCVSSFIRPHLSLASRDKEEMTLGTTHHRACLSRELASWKFHVSILKRVSLQLAPGYLAGFSNKNRLKRKLPYNNIQSMQYNQVRTSAI